jgi:hypothetical protein
MRSDSARLHGTAFVVFFTAILFYFVTAPFTPVWPTNEPVTVAGLWLIDMIARVPIGAAIARVAVVAVVASACAAALIAWLIAHRGYSMQVAAGCALLTAFSVSVWRQAIADAPGAVAALLFGGGIAIATAHFRSVGPRIVLSAMMLIAAAALQPLLVAVAPIIVASAARASALVVSIAGVFGIFLTWLLTASETPLSAAAAFSVAREDWLLPGLALMAAGLATPLWGAAPPPTIAVIGTALGLLQAGVRHDTAALAIFPAMLLAHGICALAAVAPRGPGVIALVLAGLAATAHWNAPVQETWRVIAWRDAIERALPPVSTIYTSTRAAAALNGPLFEGRPAGIRLAYVSPEADRTASPMFVLDDMRAAAEMTGSVVAPVTLSFNGAGDLLTRLPKGTVVGLAISAAAATANQEDVAAALRAIGWAPGEAMTGPVVVTGVAGSAPVAANIVAKERLHVLLGDLIDGRKQRSPADFELRASVAEITIRIQGQDRAAGSGWAVVAFEPGGTLIDVVANDVGGPEWPLRVPGLGVWRAGDPPRAQLTQRPSSNRPTR